MPMKNSFRVLAAALLCLLSAGLSLGWWRSAEESSLASATPTIGGPFTLTNAEDGSTVTERSYRGKIMLIYFGYTYCPDACPTTLNTIVKALDELGPLADHVQTLFITIDPQRDTRAVLSDYVKSFGPRIVGLTGTPAQIAAAAKVYRVYYAPHEAKDLPNGYLMDHTSVVFIMDENGRFLATFTPDTSAAQMADRLSKLVAKTS
jgi:protein SCO1